MIIYTSALVGIGTEYYEAASIDGASRWKQFTVITVPLLRPMMIMLMVLSVGRMFYSDFGLFYQVTMNSGILYRTTSTIDTYVYNALMQTGDISMSSAAGCFQSVVGFICIMTMNLIVRKFDRQQALF